MKWLKGRQKDLQYYKLKIWSFKLFKYGFDFYILHYPKYGILPVHKDEVKNGKHYRLNINLKGSNKFFINNNKGFLKHIKRKFILFRPDIHEHFLEIYTETYKLSFGFVKYK